LDLHYKIDSDVDHMAEFHGDWPRSSEILWGIKK